MRNANRTGIVALLAVGGYYLWRNRAQVQQYIQSSGIRFPQSTNEVKEKVREVSEAVRSKVSQVSGAIEDQARHLTGSANQSQSQNQNPNRNQKVG
jgi:hypothetical protein